MSVGIILTLFLCTGALAIFSLLARRHQMQRAKLMQQQQNGATLEDVTILPDHRGTAHARTDLHVLIPCRSATTITGAHSSRN